MSASSPMEDEQELHHARPVQAITRLGPTCHARAHGRTALPPLPPEREGVSGPPLESSVGVL